LKSCEKVKRPRSTTPNRGPRLKKRKNSIGGALLIAALQKALGAAGKPQPLKAGMILPRLAQRHREILIELSRDRRDMALALRRPRGLWRSLPPSTT